MNNKLKVKDLINVAIFSALYIIVMTIFATVLGAVPILYLTIPFFLGITNGIIYMILCLRAPKTGTAFLMAVIVFIPFISSMIYPLIWAILVGLISELLLTKGGYKSLKRIMTSYIVFACLPVGPFITILINKNVYIKSVLDYGGQEYADKIDALTPPWIILVLVAIGMIGGFIGARVGKRLLSKHFKKAGVV